MENDLEKQLDNLTPEQKERLLKEREDIVRKCDLELKRHTNIRIKQALDIKSGKEPKDVTKADVELLKKLHYNSEGEQDNRMILFYEKQSNKLYVKAGDVKSLHFGDSKKIVITYIWSMYNKCHKALVELGEIETIENKIDKKLEDSDVC